jgi:hypothetical protein
MQDQHNAPLVQYIEQAYRAGASIDAIRTELLKSGWRSDVVEPALQSYQAARKLVNPHQVRDGVLWILSAFILFALSALIQFIMRFTLNSANDMGVISIFRIVINIFSLVLGLVAVPLIIVGPIIGIIKLTKK